MKSFVEILIEKMVDIKKFDTTNSESNVETIVNILKNLNIKAKIDDKTGSGEMYISGLGNVKFSVGGENFYVDIPEFNTKYNHENIIKSLISLGKTID